MIPMCILNDDLLGFEFIFGLRDFSPSSVVHYVSPQSADHYASPPVRTVSSIQAQDTTSQPDRKPITYDIIEGHMFPTPDQVHPNDAIFKVVKAEIHREPSEDLTNANGESDRASSTSSYCEQEEGWNESVSPVTDESSLETYSTSGSDEEVSVDENQEESTGDMKPSKASINDDGAVAGTSAISISVKPLPKVVGCVSNPNLATMKFTTAGKVWLWDRPEDILVIKEDGRIIDPASNTAKKRHQKSYQQQVKLSASKLYDYFFSKKTNSAGNKGNWGTTSLDRRAVMSASQAKRDFHVSLSSYDILSSDEK